MFLRYTKGKFSTMAKQIKLSLSEQLHSLLEEKSQGLGLPLTQYIRYLLIKAAEKQTPLSPAIQQKLIKRGVTKNPVIFEAKKEDQ